MKKTLICGFYGNHNLGDEAMLSGMLQLLKRQNEDLSFMVFSDTPRETKKRFGVESLERNNRELKFKIQRLIEFFGKHYFVLGGGDLLRDTAKSSIAKIWLKPLARAIKFQHRTMILGISVGEIIHPETKRIIPQVLNQVDFIGVRDQRSQQRLMELGVNQSIYVMSDLALEVLDETLLPRKTNQNQPLHIGISVRHLQGRGVSVDVGGYDNLQKEIAIIADFLSEKYGAIIHFLPLRTNPNSYHPIDDDYVSILQVLRYSSRSKNFIVHRYFPSLDDFYQVISSLDLVIGMRLHSLIIAAGLGVPIIAAEYDPKVKGFMEEISQGDRSIPLDKFHSDQVINIIETIINDLDHARQELKIGVKNYRQKMVIVESEISKIFR